MRRAGFPSEEAEAAVRRAVEEELIDDRVYAKLWVDDRLLHHPLSRRAIERELEAKGIPHEQIVRALDASYPASRESEIARELATARWTRLASTEPDARRRRAMDHLLRRGFPAGLAADAVRRAEREEDSRD
ncbi:MAG: regulatory protein RecX [Candidatus Bipolaricaulis sp.]|nr:regulatory protein RecX [Candidatus Bipolaricaulis sp.]